MNAKIVTYTGKTFDLLNPTPDMVCIEDIAHSLANLCRYTGHTRKFYSVAQHCVLAARVNDPNDPLQRLLHDASEAYIGDLASPWKRLLWVEDGVVTRHISVRVFEQKIQDVIGLALGVDLTHSMEIKHIDNRMYSTEIRDLMPPSDEFAKWKGNLKPFKDKIVCWNPLDAEAIFLFTYRKLKG